MDFFGAWKIAGPERDERASCDGGDGEAEKAATDSEDQAFSEALADEAAPAGAEPDAHGESALARDGAGEEQAGDVDAGDEKDEANRREKQPERGADVADNVLLEAARGESDAGVGIRIELCEIAGEERELSLRLGQGCAGTEARDHAKETRAPKLQARLEGGSDRRVDVDFATDLEARRHDADDKGGATVEGNCCADDGRICGEATAEQRVADDCDGRCAGLIFVW